MEAYSSLNCLNYYNYLWNQWTIGSIGDIPIMHCVQNNSTKYTGIYSSKWEGKSVLNGAHKPQKKVFWAYFLGWVGFEL